MRFWSPRVVLAVGALALAVALPPAWLVARFLPPEFAARQSQLYSGLWLLKIFLGLNAALWLAWPVARSALGAAREVAAGREPLAQPVRLERGEWVLLAVLSAVAAVLRGWGLETLSLGYDEIYIAGSMIRKTPLHIFVLGSPTSGQFANWLAWASTQLFGFSEVTMRLPALLFGVAAVPMTYLFGRRWLGRAAGGGAAVLLTVSTYAISYSQELKGYTATYVFALGATWASLKARERGSPRDWLVYGVLVLLLGFAHPFGLWVALGHGLIALALPDRKRLLPPLLVTGVYVAGTLGLFFSVSIPLTDIGTHELHPAAAALADDLVRHFGAQLSASPWSYALAGLAFLGAVRLGWTNPVLLAAFLAPVAIGFVLNEFVLACMYPRYFSFALPAFYLLASFGGVSVAGAAGALAERARLGNVAARGAEVLVPLALLAVWTWPCWESWRGYHARERYPYKAVARYVSQNCGGSAVVAAGLGADKVRFYAPEIRFLPDVATLSEVVLRDRPEYVVTFCPETYRRQAAALGHNPLAGYHVVYQKVCHLEEGEVANDGFVWRRGPDTMRARATRRKGGRTTASLSQ